MPFRGFFALNGVELTNTSRTVAHLGAEVPVNDIGLFDHFGNVMVEDPPGSGLYIPDSDETPPGSGLYDVVQDHLVLPENPEGSGLYSTGRCQLIETGRPGLYELPPSSVPVPGHPGLYTPPDGAVLYSPGLFLIEDGCWGSPHTCPDCTDHVGYDDSWPGLRDYLADTVYRTELAPWHSTRVPESTEFAGIWVMDVKGLGPLAVERPLTELVGSGAAAGPSRDPSRTISFEALLVGCTNAGVEYGLDWLACRLRELTYGTASTMQYFTSHPARSGADAATLAREVHGVVLKTGVTVEEEIITGSGPNRQGNIYRVSWELAATQPYSYAPPVHVEAVWDEIEYQPIEWVHAPQCTTPTSCEAMPVLFSQTCAPEVIEVVSSPPPSCGGCMPLCTLETYVFNVPTLSYPLRCSETAVSMTIKNTGAGELTLQGYWRSCIDNVKCDVQEFPIQIAGLPATAMLSLDAIEGRYWAVYEDSEESLDPRQVRITPGLRGKRLQPRGIVGTPNGSPWTPPIINREDCWEFVVVAPPYSDFEVRMALIDREA